MAAQKLSSSLLQRRELFLRVLPSSPSLRQFDRHIHFAGNDGADTKSDNSSESADDFERRVFSGKDDSSNFNSFYRKLDKHEKLFGTSGTGFNMNDRGQFRSMDGLSESVDTLSDGMDSKLKKAARTFIVSDEIQNEDYSFRPDMTFRPGSTYTPRDLDLTKPGIPKQFKPPQFETTTEEVLKKADFRNVRFLQNFLTEAGIIIKRSQTRISAKAQRKVAREIKTARAFGLMPFTTMGTKPFSFGRSMDPKYMMSEDEYVFNNNMQDAAREPPLEET
ncbi:Ribosomal protein S18 protein [Dioscorea alata]|uniref:Ribosomal protein S18 protein n=1 Tax=Dioscorea alata TaxID=55571 RepID=A0ACB7TZ95_DIOAL|nr:Ribosomal protein S18 protein [Dioscorea alata]